MGWVTTVIRGRVGWVTNSHKDKSEGRLLFFPFLLPSNLPPFPSLTQSYLALTTCLSLILPGALDSFSTQNCPRRSMSQRSAILLILSLNASVQYVVLVFYRRHSQDSCYLNVQLLLLFVVIGTRPSGRHGLFFSFFLSSVPVW